MSKKERQKDFYQRHRARLIKERTDRKKKIRRWVQEKKETLECVRCGFSHPAALQFHHLSSSEKSFDIGSAVSSGRSIADIQHEMEKCEVLCANCHAIEHFGN